MSLVQCPGFIHAKNATQAAILAVPRALSIVLYCIALSGKCKSKRCSRPSVWRLSEVLVPATSVRRGGHYTTLTARLPPSPPQIAMYTPFCVHRYYSHQSVPTWVAYCTRLREVCNAWRNDIHALWFINDCAGGVKSRPSLEKTEQKQAQRLRGRSTTIGTGTGCPCL